MSTTERLRQLVLQHGEYYSKISTEWRRADETMLEFQIAGMGRETGGYESIAKDERGNAKRLIADYHDKVVLPLLPHVDEMLQRELIAQADRLYEDIQDPRKPWSPRYRDRGLRIDRLLSAKLRAKETAEIEQAQQAAQQRAARDPATLPHPYVGDDLLRYLADRPDGIAAVIELPKRFCEPSVLTVSDADGLIDFGTRNHCSVGAVGKQQVSLESGWNFSSVTGPNRIPMKQFIAEALSFTGDERIRQHVRLTAQGRIRAARLIVDRPASQVEQKPKTTATDWRDIQRRLERLRDQGEEYTTQAKLGEKLDCSPSTINKAIRHSTKLNAWKAEATAPRGKQAPHASSLTEVHLDSTAQTREENPADVLSDEDIDRAMHRLIEEAEPEEKVRLNALSEDERRTLVRVFYEQNLDKEPSPLAPDRPDRPRTVRQFKHL